MRWIYWAIRWGHWYAKWHGNRDWYVLNEHHEGHYAGLRLGRLGIYVHIEG